MYGYGYGNYKKEERFCITYVSKRDGETKQCYPRSKEAKDEQLTFAREHGVKVLKCEKLYPFSTEKNQHNFFLVYNVCKNRMHDMDMGDVKYDEAEYERLQKESEKADLFIAQELPVAWVPYKMWSEMKEMSTMAVLHRQGACIEAGRPDLVQYC